MFLVFINPPPRTSALLGTAIVFPSRKHPAGRYIISGLCCEGGPVSSACLPPGCKPQKLCPVFPQLPLWIRVWIRSWLVWKAPQSQKPGPSLPQAGPHLLTPLLCIPLLASQVSPIHTRCEQDAGPKDNEGSNAQPHGWGELPGFSRGGLLRLHEGGGRRREREAGRAWQP